MTADVLSRYDPENDDGNNETGDIITNEYGQTGRFEYVQNEDSGAFERKWLPYTEETDDDDNPIPPTRSWEFSCIVRSIIDGGIRVAGTTERFTRRGVIETVDYATMKFPPHVLLSRRDRITNIRDTRSGRVLWAEEELGGKPTIFEVNGTSPVIDPFGKHVENFALLERAQIQQ